MNGCDASMQITLEIKRDGGGGGGGWKVALYFLYVMSCVAMFSPLAMDREPFNLVKSEISWRGAT